jgi:hypothetical protein
MEKGSRSARAAASVLLAGQARARRVFLSDGLAVEKWLNSLIAVDLDPCKPCVP